MRFYWLTQANTCRRRFPLLFLAAALLALGVFFAQDTPPPAQAQAPVTTWSATFTPSERVSNTVGCFTKTECNGALTDNSFTVGSTDFAMEAINLIGGNARRLIVTFDPDISTALDALKFCVGSSGFTLSSADAKTDDTRSFDDTGLTAWSVNDKIPVSIGTACAPGAVTGLDGTRGSEKSDLSWTAPTATGGSAITGYHVHYTSSTTVGDDDAASGNDPSAGWVDAGHTGTTASFELTGFTPGEDYKARVRAVNAAGSSPWTRVTGVRASNANANLSSLTASGSDSADGTYTAFALTGPTSLADPVWSGTLTAQRLTSGGNDDGFGCVAGQSDAECSSTSVLTDNDFSLGGKDYTISRIKDSPDNVFAMIITASSGVPAADLKALNVCFNRWALSLSSLNDGGTVSWANTNPGWAAGDKVRLSIGSSCASAEYAGTVPSTVTHVKLTPTAEDAAWYTDAFTGRQGGTTLHDVPRHGTSRAYELSQGDNAFIVAVRADDFTVWKRHTVIITQQPPDPPPGVPEDVRLSVGSQTLTLRWTKPTGTVTGYDVHYTSSTTAGDDDPAQGGGSASGWWDHSHSGTGTTSTVTGLTNGTTYRMRVRAVNAQGSSGWIFRSGVPAQVDDTVSLSASPNPVDEGSSVTITATLSAAQSGAVTIPITITDGTAEPEDHGTLTSISITAGATTGTGTITTAQDADAANEVFTVALGTLPSGLRAGSPRSVPVTIVDDEGSGAVGQTIWTGALTVQQIRSDYLGCDRPVHHRIDGEPVARRITDYVCEIHLSPHTFSHGGTT